MEKNQSILVVDQPGEVLATVRDDSAYIQALNEAWKAKLLDGRTLERNERGYMVHPDIHQLPEGITPRDFFAACGIELHTSTAENEMGLDAYEAMTANGSGCRAWTPAAPEAPGWSLVAIFDTEDGPTAWWMRAWPALALAEVLGSTCIDGGKCHHACTERCFRRECCHPLSASGMTLMDFRYPDCLPSMQAAPAWSAGMPIKPTLKSVDAAAEVMSEVMAHIDLGQWCGKFERALSGLRAVQATTQEDIPVPAHTLALRTIAEYPVTNAPMNMDAENMRRIAGQALSAKAAAEPLPLLVRDLARELHITAAEACIALKPLGNFSVNSAVTAEMATKLNECFPVPMEALDERAAFDDFFRKLNGLHPDTDTTFRSDAAEPWKYWQARAAYPFAPAAKAVAVPAGYALVPVNPTAEMCKAANWSSSNRQRWADMLLAAPALATGPDLRATIVGTPLGIFGTGIGDIGIAYRAGHRAALQDAAARVSATRYVLADQAYSVLQLYKDLQDVWQEANAVDTVIGRPDALMQKLTRIRDAVASAVNGYLPIALTAVTGEGEARNDSV